MNSYIFKTTTTMKEYNNKKWWIDSGIVREIHINAENLKDAINQYRTIVEEKYYISISDNAIKNKSPMYAENKHGEDIQIGFVFTGKTDFQDNSYKWSTQYIDLWVQILTVTKTNFEAA